MPRALIADDEAHLARHLASQLQALWPALEIVAVSPHGLDAARRIAELEPDLAFLDIQMPGLTGLEVAEGIEGPTRVVFVTAYDQHAVQAFEAEALDYLLKPVQTARLERCVERLQRALETPAAATTSGTEGDARLAQALRRIDGHTGTASAIPPPAPLRWIRAGAGDLTHQIDIADVLYFQSDDKYTCVRTATGEHLIRTSISELARQLDPQQFWQVHRSTLVNLAHLAGTRRDDASRLWLRIRGRSEELPVSRAYVHLFRAM